MDWGDATQYPLDIADAGQVLSPPITYEHNVGQVVRVGVLNVVPHNLMPFEKIRLGHLDLAFELLLQLLLTVDYFLNNVDLIVFEETKILNLF